MSVTILEFPGRHLLHDMVYDMDYVMMRGRELADYYTKLFNSPRVVSSPNFSRLMGFSHHK